MSTLKFVMSSSIQQDAAVKSINLKQNYSKFMLILFRTVLQIINLKTNSYGLFYTKLKRDFNKHTQPPLCLSGVTSCSHHHK